MKLADCVDVVSKHITGSAIRTYDRFVGLEHYDTGEVEISRWGKTDMLESAVKEFDAGDVLVARRNVYLKRASVAKFGGVTSGDSIVLRAKDKSVAAFLPFVLNTNAFWDFADQNADGTMSKRLSPKVMLDFSFSLPPLAEQKKLAETLWAMERVKRAYKNLLAETDRLTEARFVEMFGEDKYEKVPLSKIGTIFTGSTPPMRNSEYYESNDICFVKPSDLSYDIARVDSSEYYVSKKAEAICRMYDPGAVLVTCIGATIGKIGVAKVRGTCNQQVNVVVPSQNCDSEYLVSAIKQYKSELLKLANTTAVPIINKSQFSTLQIPLPPLALQREFAAFVAQAEKAKASLQSSLAALTAAQKSLMNRAFKE